MMQSLLLVKTALISLRRNMMRSLLTMLGIIIGICAVVIMVSLGQGAQRQVEQQIAELGENLLTVFPSSGKSGGVRMARGGKYVITERDLVALQAEIPEIEAVSGSVSGNGQLVVGNRNWSSSIVGIQPAWLTLNNWTVSEGRPIEAQDVSSSRKVALIGETLRQELFDGDDPIGQTIRVNRTNLTVIGVLAGKGVSTRGQDQDDTLLIPLSTAKRRVLGIEAKNRDKVSSVQIKVAREEDLAWASEEIIRVLDQRHKSPAGESRFQVFNFSEFMSARAETRQVFNTLLSGVAAVSLLVGGIGVMNIMLVTVTERTREIGLRMAVGATPGNILQQFLTEAVVLCLLGALVGVALSVGSLLFMELKLGWAVALSSSTLLMSLAVTSAMGIFFGFYPAWKASRLDPIDALRYE